jgi:hypothetical protein
MPQLGQGERDEAEEGVVGPRVAGTRRLSVSNFVAPGDIYYDGGRTLVFGMKTYTGAWAYKIFHPRLNTWEIM